MHGQKTLTKLNCPPFGEVQRSEPKFKEALNGAVALARRDSGKKVPRLGELCAWHRRVFGDFVPRGFSYYAGNIRQKKNKAPCLARDVAVNGVTGSPWQKTKADLQSLLLEVATTLVPLENSWDDTEVTGQAPIFFRRKSGSTLGSDRDLRLVWSRTRKRRFPREARHVSMP
jgi:hypothetical protein